jgi:hypothetical protein
MANGDPVLYDPEHCFLFRGPSFYAFPDPRLPIPAVDQARLNQRVVENEKMLGFSIQLGLTG